MTNKMTKQLELFLLFYFLCLISTLVSLFLSVGLSNFSNIFPFLFIFFYILFNPRFEKFQSIFCFITIFVFSFLISKNILFSFGADYLTNHSKSYFFIANGHNPIQDWSTNLTSWSHEIIKSIWYYGEYLGFWGGALTSGGLIQLFKDGSMRLSAQLPIVLFIFYSYCTMELTKQISNAYIKILINCFIIFNPIVFGILGSGYFDMYLPMGMIINTYLAFKYSKNKNFQFVLMIMMLSILVSVTRLDTLIFINIFNLFLLIQLKYFKKIIIFEKKFIISSLLYFFIILAVTSNPLIRVMVDFINNGFNFDSIIQNTNMWYEKGNYLFDNSRLQIFFDSILSPTAGNPEFHPLKIHKFLTILDFAEIKQMINIPPTDLRSGGFGPFWGFSFVISIVLFFLIIKNKIINKNLSITFYLSSFTLLAMLSLARYPFILRYVSFIYFFPIIPLVSIYIYQINKSNFINIVSYLLIFTLVANTLLNAGTSLYRIYYLNIILNKHNDFYNSYDYQNNLVTLENFHGYLLQNDFLDHQGVLNKKIRLVNDATFKNECEIFFRSYKSPFFLCVDEINKKKEETIKKNCNLIEDIPYNTNFNKKYIFKNDFPLLWEIIDKKNLKKINCS